MRSRGNTKPQIFILLVIHIIEGNIMQIDIKPLVLVKLITDLKQHIIRENISFNLCNVNCL